MLVGVGVEIVHCRFIKVLVNLMQKLSGQKCSCLVDWVEIVGAGGGGRG